ncbi:MAG: thioredoxin [Bacteroidales bacterium]|nr:thioredoxin [Bacteroidales bacterium]
MRKIAFIIGLFLAASITINAQKPEYLDETSFKEKVYDFEKNKSWQYEGNTAAIVDFYADWCGPCKYVAPFLEELAAEYGTNIKIYKVNTDHNQNVASAFGITGIPTFLFITANGEKKKKVGAMAKSGFEKEIIEYLKLSK